MIRQVPRLETERLILRAFHQDDLDAHAATLADEEVMRFIGGRPLGREDSWRRLLLGVGMWSLIGTGPWAVELKADGRMIGHTGFFEFHRDADPSIEGEHEMGWIFDRKVQGQRIAFEACSAALEWADRELRAASYPAIIGLENIRSINLAERLGFVRQGPATYHGAPVALYRRPGKSAA